MAAELASVFSQRETLVDASEAREERGRGWTRELTISTTDPEVRPQRQLLSEDERVVVFAEYEIFGTSAAEALPREPPWLAPTINAFDALTRLAENWDSYGAKPVKPEAVSNAIQVLIGIMLPDTPVPAVVPTPAGGIQLEWHTAGVDLEVEITSKGERLLLFQDLQQGVEFEGVLDQRELTAFLEKVSGR